MVKRGKGRSGDIYCGSQGLEPISKSAVCSGNFQYLILVSMVRPCLMRVDVQAGDGSGRRLHQYLFGMLLRPLVGDMITAGIPIGVPKKQVSTQASHHDKHQGPLTEDKTIGVLISR